MAKPVIKPYVDSLQAELDDLEREFVQVPAGAAGQS